MDFLVRMLSLNTVAFWCYIFDLLDRFVFQPRTWTLHFRFYSQFVCLCNLLILSYHLVGMHLLLQITRVGVKLRDLRWLIFVLRTDMRKNRRSVDVSSILDVRMVLLAISHCEWSIMKKLTRWNILMRSQIWWNWQVLPK